MKYTHEVRIKYRKNPRRLLTSSCPTVDSLIDFMKEETEDFDWRSTETQKFKGVIGLSGGLDSAVVAELAVRALGKDNVYGIMMPSETSENIDLEYAVKQAEKLGIKYDIIPINEVIDAYTKIKGYFDTNLQKGNVAARARMTILYDKAKQVNGMVLGTSNRSEYMTGYFTKFGDGAADLEPILQLYKTQVKKIAKELKIPKEIINRKPTAGLWEGQTDEEELGVDYKTLDIILLGHELGFGQYELERITGLDDKLIYKVLGYVERSRHKRDPPPSPKPKFRDIVWETLQHEGVVEGTREDYTGCLDEYWDRIFDELRTKEDHKEHILKIFSDKGWRWYCYKGGWPDDEIRNIHYWLLKINQRFPQQTKSYLTNFEDASLDILIDKKIAYKKVGWSNDHYIGRILYCNISNLWNYDKSPNIENGRLAKKVIPHVRLDDLIDKKIRKNSTEYIHQRNLLAILHTVKTYDVPGEEFWKKAERLGLGYGGDKI